MSVKIDRRDEERMRERYTPDKVMKILQEAALAGGMAGRTLRYGDPRIPWSVREAQLFAVIERYSNGRG
jgi:hypothetical protein